LQIKFEEIMMYLVYKFGQDFLFNFIKNENSKVLHFKKIIEKNSLNNLNVQEISFLCNMSVSTFKREFKKYYNESPRKWFQKQRLLHAKFLLRSNEKRPTDLYEEIGFLSLSSFTQAFKIQFGLTP
ncbi:AraC family transcriptional regulator, partial [Flavobacterium oncorhynchi]